MKTTTLLALITLAVALPVHSQQAQRVEESVQVTLVEVPASVIDRSGNPVRGLTARNFQLFDQGKKREISYFEELDLAALESVDVVSAMNPAARRNFLLLFD